MIEFTGWLYWLHACGNCLYTIVAANRGLWLHTQKNNQKLSCVLGGPFGSWFIKMAQWTSGQYGKYLCIELLSSPIKIHEPNSILKIINS